MVAGPRVFKIVFKPFSYYRLSQGALQVRPTSLWFIGGEPMDFPEPADLQRAPGSTASDRLLEQLRQPDGGSGRPCGLRLERNGFGTRDDMGG
jgi:hypothetical protein